MGKNIVYKNDLTSWKKSGILYFSQHMENLYVQQISTCLTTAPTASDLNKNINEALIQQQANKWNDVSFSISHSDQGFVALIVFKNYGTKNSNTHP